MIINEYNLICFFWVIINHFSYLWLSKSTINARLPNNGILFCLVKVNVLVFFFWLRWNFCSLKFKGILKELILKEVSIVFIWKRKPLIKSYSFWRILIACYKRTGETWIEHWCPPVLNGCWSLLGTLLSFSLFWST